VLFPPCAALLSRVLAALARCVCHLFAWHTRLLSVTLPPPAPPLQVGTLIIVDGASKADVTAWAATDPYAKAGLFASVTVWPMKKVVEGGKVLV